MTGLRLPESLAGREVVVVDVEGNGRQPPEIIELALLPLTADRAAGPDDVVTWLIRPEQPITGIVTVKVHGISNVDVAHAPPWIAVADHIGTALSGHVLVAHNASVEHRVLSAHLPGWEPPLMLDTLRLAKVVRPELAGGYGLDNLITHLALPLPAPLDTGTRRHRAGFDTWMTAQVFLALLDDLDDVGETTWERVVAAAAPGPAAPPASAADQKEGLW